MRITGKKAHAKFASMVGYAQEIGIDMSGWRFGQFYGNLYNLERPHSVYPDTHTAVESWYSPREAWDYMNAMITAFAVVKKSNEKRDLPELQIAA